VKIALTADPEIPVPPQLYGGIERIIDLLVQGLIRQGHDVTLFAHPDSKVPCRLVKWKGARSQSTSDTLKNTVTLCAHVMREHYDLIHSFSRLAYLMPVMPMAIPKIMSYQREPSRTQVSKAVRLSRKGSLFFTGCSNYITNKIEDIADAATVYNCVPMERYNLSESVPDDAPLSFLGRIEPIKGTHIAVEVARRTGRGLIIAGNIPAEGKEYFEEKIRPFLNDSIQYVGPVNDKQKNELLGRSAAFLMPIQWNEPFGIVMAEAMACGTPVLGFPFGSVPEVVEDGRNGFVCKDVDDMVQKVGQLNSISRKQVREIAEERFSDTTIVRDYLRVYEQLTQKHSVYSK
jgi:glycosyltransferase involved in cell wall biosynthesis